MLTPWVTLKAVFILPRQDLNPIMANSEIINDCASEMPQSGTAEKAPKTAVELDSIESKTTTKPSEKPREIGGRNGPDPTRYGDWESKGRCIDF